MAQAGYPACHDAMGKGGILYVAFTASFFDYQRLV